jgi:hypothetical protein
MVGKDEFDGGLVAERGDRHKSVVDDGHDFPT